MMEEYTEVEEEVGQETQSGAVQEEERPETRTKNEQLTEETRKRKIGVEEAGAKQRDEKVSDFDAELSYFT